MSIVSRVPSMLHVGDRVLSDPTRYETFVTSKRDGGVTINRSNEVTGLSMRFNCDSCAYRHTQRIHYTKMSSMDTCTMVFDIFVYWCDWSLGGWWPALFYLTNKSHCVTITTCAFAQNFNICITAVKQPAKCRWGCFYFKTLVYWWTRYK